MSDLCWEAGAKWSYFRKLLLLWGVMATMQQYLMLAQRVSEFSVNLGGLPRGDGIGLLETYWIEWVCGGFEASQRLCPAHSSIFRTRNRCLSLAAEMVGRSKAEWRTVSVERMKQRDSKSAPMKHWSSKTNSDKQSLAWGVLGAGLPGLTPPLTLTVALWLNLSCFPFFLINQERQWQSQHELFDSWL